MANGVMGGVVECGTGPPGVGIGLPAATPGWQAETRGSRTTIDSGWQALLVSTPPNPGGPVSDHVYRITEVVGSSPESVQQAIRNGVSRVSRTVRNVEWFEATQIRGHVVDGEIDAFQVTLKVGFRLED